MSLQILQALGDAINTLNPGVFNTYAVNGIQLQDGRIVKFEDAKEKTFIGIEDVRGTAFYIRVNPAVTSANPGRRLSSLSRPNQEVISCRLVAYSFDESQVSETFANKLKSDLSRIQFQSVGGLRPTITVRRSNTNYIANFLEEVLKTRFDGGDEFVCVSIDFDLRYSPEECDTCVPVDPNAFWVVIKDQEGNIIDRRQAPDEYNVLVFSGIHGGTPSTTYTNSIVGGTP